MPLVLAVALLMQTAPGPATGELPDWLLGTWCRPPDRRSQPVREQLYSRVPTGASPDWGGECITWTQNGEDRLSGRSEFGLSGLPNKIAVVAIDRVGRRLRYGTGMWEVARGPGELVFEARSSSRIAGPPPRLKLRREGDTLKIGDE